MPSELNSAATNSGLLNPLKWKEATPVRFAPSSAKPLKSAPFSATSTKLIEPPIPQGDMQVSANPSSTVALYCTTPPKRHAGEDGIEERRDVVDGAGPGKRLIPSVCRDVLEAASLHAQCTDMSNDKRGSVSVGKARASDLRRAGESGALCELGNGIG